MMQDMWRMSRNRVMTMLQDLATFGLITFDQGWDEDEERMTAKKIELTAAGVALVTRRKDTTEVLFS
jgi:hypothetical protein